MACTKHQFGLTTFFECGQKVFLHPHNMPILYMACRSRAIIPEESFLFRRHGMYYNGGSDSLYLILLLALMIVSAFASRRVQTVFSKYSGIRASSGIPAEQAASDMLRSAGSACRIVPVSGTLTDHFDPRENTVGLSTGVYGQNSVSALAVTAHEIGHVLQYEQDYSPIRLRNAVLPVAGFSSAAAPWIVIGGLFFGSYNLAMIGVILFGTVLLFQLVTLPVEFNASSRGLSLLEQGGYLSTEQLPMAKEVLRAAAMTYVFSALASLISFLRLLNIANRSRRN